MPVINDFGLWFTPCNASQQTGNLDIMVKVFHTHAATHDVAAALFGRALEELHIPGDLPDFSSILYVAPSGAMLNEARRVFHSLFMSRSRQSGSTCYIPPGITTIRQFSRNVYASAGDRRIIGDPLVPVILSRLSGRGIAFSSIIYEFIRDVRATFPDRTHSDIRAVFNEAFNALNIPEPIIRRAADCLDLMEKYTGFKEEHGLADSDDLLDECRRSMHRDEKRLLIVHGFFDPAKAEQEFLKTLISCSGKALVSIPAGLAGKAFYGLLKASFDIDEAVLMADPDKQGRRPAYTSAADPEEEVEGIARAIKVLFLSGKVQDLERVVVAFPDLSRYAALVNRVFRRYGIPFDTSNKQPLARRRPFMDLISLLRAVSDDFPRLPFTQFLSSRYFRKIPGTLRQCMPYLSLISGTVSGRNSWAQIVEGDQGDAGMAGLDKAAAGKDLQAIFRRLDPLRQSDNAGFSSLADSLRRVLDDTGFLSTGSDPGQVEEISGEKKSLDSVLDNLSLIGTLFPAEVRMEAFVETLGHLLLTSHSEETEIPGVRVMAFSDLAGLSPDYLFFGGLTDDAMPGMADLDHILPDSVKRRLGFPYLEQRLDRQRSLFQDITVSARHCRLSYPRMEAERVNLPSPFLYPSEEIKEEIPGIYSEEELLVRSVGRPLTSYLDEISLYPSHGRFSGTIRVTDVDAYRSCPRRFAIERIFRVMPPEVREYEVDAKTLGIIVHRIMERLIAVPVGDLETFQRRAYEICDEVLRNQRIDDYWRELIRDSFIGTLPEIYETEQLLREKDYEKSEVEKPVAGEPLPGIKLKGKVDRIDWVGGEARIIDYKTGAADLTCSRVLKGNENLQLFLYAAILGNMGLRVERVGLYSLRDIKLKWCPQKKRGTKKGKAGGEGLAEYVGRSLGFLKEAADSMRAGDLGAKPLEDYKCRNCHEYALCPYIQQ